MGSDLEAFRSGVLGFGSSEGEVDLGSQPGSGSETFGSGTAGVAPVTMPSRFGEEGDLGRTSGSRVREVDSSVGVSSGAAVGRSTPEASGTGAGAGDDWCGGASGTNGSGGTTTSDVFHYGRGRTYNLRPVGGFSGRGTSSKKRGAGSEAAVAQGPARARRPRFSGIPSRLSRLFHWLGGRGLRYCDPGPLETLGQSVGREE